MGTVWSYVISDNIIIHLTFSNKLPQSNYYLRFLTFIPCILFIKMKKKKILSYRIKKMENKVHSINDWKS